MNQKFINVRVKSKSLLKHKPERSIIAIKMQHVGHHWEDGINIKIKKEFLKKGFLIFDLLHVPNCTTWLI